MNCQCNIFIYSLVTSQHLLNKPLAKREINKRVSVVSQLLFWLVEILLRMYIVYCQCIYTHIQQFNRKMIILQGFKLLPCDGVEASHSPYRLIPTLPIAVELVGGISQSVWRRGQFPPGKTWRIFFLVKIQVLAIFRSLIGNDLETSKILYFTSFCSNSKERFS